MSDFQAAKSDTSVAAVSNLVTDLADVIEGYEVMVEKAEDDLVHIVTRLLDLHRDHIAPLMEMQNSMGGNPQTAGSLMGTVHSSVAKLRDMTGTLDASALDEILRGEERILDSYDASIRDTASHADVNKMIVGQRDALRGEIERIKS